MIRPPAFALALVLVATTTASLLAQGGGGAGGGGGRGAAAGASTSGRPGARRSEATYDRVGAWFVDVRIDGELKPADPEAKEPDMLSTLPFVDQAKADGNRALVYLYDPQADADKHELFERTLFQDEVGIATRFFVCARIDLSAASSKGLKERYGKDAPLFVAFDATKKQVGELSLTGYKANARSLEQMLAKAVGKDQKPGLPQFVKQYGEVVHELEKLEQQTAALDADEDKVEASDKEKRAEIARERKALAAAEKKQFAEERELLEAAKLQPRPAAAVRLGGRGGAQRARGNRGAGGAPGGGGGADPAGGGAGGARDGG